MRRGHRQAHRILWLVLVPCLFIALMMALALRKPPLPSLEQILLEEPSS